MVSDRHRAIRERKSALMYGLLIGGWILTIVASAPFFVDLLQQGDGWAVTGLLAIIVGSLCVFWLFGFYNVVVTAFGYLTWDRPDVAPYEDFRDEAVAIIYPTYNDFSQYHLDKSRDQTHANTHVYIVDDSTDEQIVNEIDAYAADDSDVTVVRREGREGYKAGAINHALETAIDEPYFALLDADEVLPEDFVENTITHFTDDEIGFVQANHDYNRETATTFGKALGIGVDVHWDVYQPPRNKYGFVMLLGHGALLRRDVWDEIGGFPELVSEDLAFATRAREHGYRGVFAPDVDCLEDFPVDYEAFRKRHKKWTAGSIEYITTELPRYLRSKATLTEKLDVLVPTLQLPLTAVFVAYIFCVGALEVLSGDVIPASVSIPWHLGAVTLGTLLSPLYCYIIGLRDRPRKLAHFVATSTTVYCSVAVIAVAHSLRVLLPWEGAEFLTTPKDATASLSLKGYYSTVGLGLLTLAIATQAGFLVGAAAFTWLLAPGMALYNRQSAGGKLVRAAAQVPMMILGAGIVWGAVVLF